MNEKITKDQFLSYERVRQSGVTNMNDVRLVIKLSGLTQEQILAIMRSYEDLSEKYL